MSKIICGHVGVSGIVGPAYICEVMRIIARNSTQSSIGGYEKNLYLPGGECVNGFVFWATAALLDDEILKLKVITYHFEIDDTRLYCE